MRWQRPMSSVNPFHLNLIPFVAEYYILSVVFSRPIIQGNG